MWTEPLREIRTVWQPILDLRSGALWGFEALTRGPEGSPWENPLELFELARLEHDEQELEAAMRRSAMRGATQSLPPDATLFVNADVRFIGMPLNPDGEPWSPARTIIEISEHSPLFDEPEALKAQIATWRAEGYRIALDDFGSGYAGQTALLAVRPDVIKIDRQLVAGIAQDAWRQAIVLSVVRMAAALDIIVIAEGIETEQERDELAAMGISFGQGFLLGRPEPRPLPGRILEESGVTEEEVKALLGNAMPQTEAAYAVDRHRRILHWNAQAALLSGSAEDEVIGKTCWLSGLEHQDASGIRLCFFACPLVATLRSGRPHAGIVSMRVKDGHRHWVTTSVSPVLDDRGKVVGAIEKFAPSRAPWVLAERELAEATS